MTKPSDWIRLLRNNAEQLRRAGVTRIKFDGLEVDLAPAEPAAATSPPRDDSEDAWGGDPLSDPATFGGAVPKFRRKAEEEFA